MSIVKTWLTRWTQKSSLLLAFDHLDEQGMEEFRTQVQEVSKYYSWSTLRQVVDDLAQVRIKEVATVLFRNPRKSILLKALPILREYKIPSTIFLRSDCIGLNRLPPQEELSIYQQKYSSHFSPGEFERMLARAWESPLECDQELKALRKTLGPLPVEQVDPLTYFATWGEIADLDKNLVEFGIGLNCSPKQSEIIGDEILFIRRQLGAAPQFGLGLIGKENNYTRGMEWKRAQIAALGLKARVGSAAGAVTKGSDCYDLPVWQFSS